MEVEKIIKIEANNLATQRTKNRIREHGAIFVQMNKSNTVTQFPGVECLLIKSMDESWTGWIPTNEISIKDSDSVISWS